MPVVAIIGATIGTEIGVGLLGTTLGNVAAGAIGGAIGGGLGGGVGSVIMGGSFSDGFKSGAIGGALGGAFNTYMSGGASAASMASADAAQLASQGLSTAQIAETLGYTGAGAGEIAGALESIGLDSTFASDAGNYGASQYANAGTSSYTGGTDLSSMFNPNAQTPQGMDNPAVTTSAYSPPDISTNILPELSTDFSISGDYSMGLDGVAQGPNLNVTGNVTPGTSLSDLGNATTMEGIGSPSINSGLSTLEGTTAPTQEFAATGQTPQVTQPTQTGSSWGLPKSLKDLMPKDMKSYQIGLAGMQTAQDYMNAQTLQKQADKAAQPYNTYMDTINNPDKYWDQYLASGGGESINKASRGYAKSGRTGILPSLYTQQRQGFMNTTLPNIRQGLQGAGTMASANMQQQMYPMAMRQRGSSYIPQVLSSMYYKGGK
jgi:hypothetical protein